MKSTILTVRHPNNSLLKEIRSILVNLDNAKFKNFSLNRYREKVFFYQKLLNNNNTAVKILYSIKDNVYSYLLTDQILIQSFLYLRCVRPLSKKTPHMMDAIPFHRESFYGKNMHKVFNVWTPVFGKKTPKALSYVPNSHLIKNKDIKLKINKDIYTKQKSFGHKLGFLYQPKEIVGGVDLKKAKEMKVPFYSTALFSGNLIHGPSTNNTNETRISLDFKIIRKKDYKKDSKLHITSLKPYFIEF